MPITVKVEGMEEISKMLNELDARAPAIAAMALYEGAGILADEMRRQIKGIRTAEFKYAKPGEKRLPSPEEKEILENAEIGIAKFDKDGAEIDTSVGFNQSGYANVNFRHMNRSARTNYKGASFKGLTSVSAGVVRVLEKHGYIEPGAKLQNQKPVGVIANSINSGTSFMTKQPFARKAAKSGGPKAMAAMKAKIEEAFGEITK